MITIESRGSGGWSHQYIACYHSYPLRVMRIIWSTTFITLCSNHHARLLWPKRWKTFLCITEVCIIYLWLYSCIIHLTTLTHQIHSIFPQHILSKARICLVHGRSFVIVHPSHLQEQLSKMHVSSTPAVSYFEIYCITLSDVIHCSSSSSSCNPNPTYEWYYNLNVWMLITCLLMYR